MADMSGQNTPGGIVVNINVAAMLKELAAQCEAAGITSANQAAKIAALSDAAVVQLCRRVLTTGFTVVP